MGRTISEVKENIYNVHGDKVTLLNESLPKYKENLSLHCNVCGNTFNATYDNFVNKKSGCPYCAGHIKTNEEFISELVHLYGDKLIYDKVNYVSAKTEVILICPKHGEFKRTPNKLLCRQGCSKCKCSLLENIVMRVLVKNNIQFEAQKRFTWLGKQSLDFYLPKYNIAIECQGEQHFHQVYFNGKTENVDKRNLFESISERDNTKFNKCEDNDIRLLYFIDNKIQLSEIDRFPIYKQNYFTEIDKLIKYILINEGGE